MQNNDLIKYEGGLIKRVGNAISVTNKLLALAEPQLIPYRKGNKWGFCNTDKKIVIDCEFDKVEEFSEGAAVVKKFGKYGFVEINGKITSNGLLRHFVILNSLKEGMASAAFDINKDKRKWGFVNKNNTEIIEFGYDAVSDFCEGLARVRINGKYGFIDKSNSIVIPFSYDNVHSFSGGFANVRIGEKWGYIDKMGNEIIPVEINSFEILESLTGKTEKSIYPKIIKKESKYCLIDQNNKPLNNMRFDCIDNQDMGFCNELMDVEINGKWGFINKEGDQIVPCIYDDVFPFFDGLACALKNEYWGFIDTIGNEAIQFIYDEVFPFSNGIAKVETERNGKLVEGYINKHGIEYWED